MLRRPDSTAFAVAAELGGTIPRVSPTVIDAIARIPHTILPALRLMPALQQLKTSEGVEGLAVQWKASQVPAVAAAARSSRL